MFTYRVVRCRKPDGSLWKSEPVLATTCRAKAIKTLRAERAMPHASALQWRFLRGDPWRFFTEREVQEMLGEVLR